MSDLGPAHERAVTALDGALVVATVLIVGGVLLGLFYVKVPQENLPIIAGIASGLVSAVIAGYAGYRWGASHSQRRTSGPQAVAIATSEPKDAAL